MEPPIIALAREMCIAANHQWCSWSDLEIAAEFDEDVRSTGGVVSARGWLAAALVARPDLADARVPKGHWASGLLKEEP